jgi:hypothetical protein
MAFARTIAFGLVSLGFLILAVVAVLRDVSWAVVATDLVGAVVFALLARRVFPRRIQIDPKRPDLP